MNEPLIDPLAERVEKLERQNRRWRWALAVVIASVMAALGLGTGGTKTLKAQQPQPVAPYLRLKSVQDIQPEVEPPSRILKVGGWYVNWHNMTSAVLTDKQQALTISFVGGGAPLTFRGEEAAAVRTFLNAVSIKLIQLPGEPAIKEPPPPPPAN